MSLHTCVCACSMVGGGLVCSILFIVTLLYSTISTWLEGSRGGRPLISLWQMLQNLLSPITVQLEHLQVFGGLNFKTSCSVRKSWCPCLRHDGDEAACPDQAGSLGSMLQSSVFLPALGLECDTCLEQGM